MLRKIFLDVAENIFSVFKLSLCEDEVVKKSASLRFASSGPTQWIASSPALRKIERLALAWTLAPLNR